MSELLIRDECSSDYDAIRSVTERAFAGKPYAGGDEQDIIERLRSVNALTVSLVAIVNGELVGHIAFSTAEAKDGSSPWFTLGPVSVAPERQCQGIGTALIENGLARLREFKGLGCILTGNPEYYQRFGFQPAPYNAPKNESAEFFMLKLLRGKTPLSAFSFHPAFYDDA